MKLSVSTLLLLYVTIATLPLFVESGIISYGVCQTGCNGLAVACYVAAGFTMGVPIPGSTPATIMACNAGLGGCMAGCALLILTPTP